MVNRSCTRARNRWSDPRSSSAPFEVVGASAYAAFPLPRPRSALLAVLRRCASLEIDISGIAEQRGFDRNMQAVVHGVVELPETDHAGELDNLRRRQMLLEPLQDLVGD